MTQHDYNVRDAPAERLRGARSERTVPIAAAVLVPLFRDHRGELRLVLVARTAALGLHGGQIGLPGGKQEPTDRSFLETALRESEEEIGLMRNEIEFVAALDPIDIRTTGFRVHSFLVRVRIPRQWNPASPEIKAVLTPTVQTLTEPQRRGEAVLSFPGWPEPRSVERIALDDRHALWGFTLRLLDRVLPRLLAHEWEI